MYRNMRLLGRYWLATVISCQVTKFLVVSLVHSPAWELSFSLPLPCPERREGGNQSERNSKMELSERNSVGFQLPRLPNGSNHKKPRQIHAVVWQMWKIPKPHWPSTPFPASQARNISAKSSKACVWVCHGNNAHGCAWHIFAYIDSHYLFLYGLTRIFKTGVLKVCISRISNHVYLWGKASRPWEQSF